MIQTTQPNRGGKQRGFSLMEMMVAMAVILIVIGGVLQLLNQSQQRYVSTANVEDSTSMAREGVDLMTREIRMAGYPPPNSYPPGIIVAGTNAQYTAIGGGFLGVAAPATPNLPASRYSIRFEADIGIPAGCGSTIPLADRQCTANTGVVSQIDYQLQVPTGGDTGGCANLTVNASLTSPTLMRSQLPKTAAGTEQVPAAADFVPFVSNVVNCTVSNPGVPIFIYCPPAAAAGGCPDLSTQRPSTLPAPRNTRAVLLRLLVQTQNRDPQTRQFQIVEFYNVAQRINPDQ